MLIRCKINGIVLFCKTKNRDFLIMQDQNQTGCLYLIPSLLDIHAIDSIPPHIPETIHSLYHFFVENERSARRYFKLLDRNISIDNREFALINTHHAPDLTLFRNWLKKGFDVGLVSEAGYPCIADPGNVLVCAAHEIRARVIPLAGPNAMLMALSASGFNGQAFRFTGYLPKTSDKRVKALKALEKRSKKYGETQIFMEAPYRNEKLMEDLLRCCTPETLLCIAADLTAPTEFIMTRSLRNWKKNRPDLHKRPAVFLLGESIVNG